MTLTLKIDNYDQLQDGGPLFVTAAGKGIQVGRSTSMDWTLPDPERHISSHHFSIEFRDNAYFLVDTSTNGVFLDGQRHRLDGAHQVQTGDRFQVGHYYITATVEGGAPKPTGFTTTAAAPPAPPPPAAPMIDDNDPWSMGGAAASPIDPIGRPEGDPFADFSQDFIVNPTPPAPQPAAPQPVQHQAGSASPFGDAAPVAPNPVVAPPPVMQPSFTPTAPQAPASNATQAAQAEALLAAFCEGAGLPAGSYGGADATELARELGRTMRVTSQELMAMLADRATAKKFTRGGERTMMGNAENNPLKFLPDAMQALEVMFLQPRPGFMQGGTGVDAALRDVRTHQMAVFAAIQPALLKLLEDIAPEAIEAEGGGGLLSGGGKRKAWDTYVERWDAKVEGHENGMLGAFLAHFAEAYRQAVDKAKR